MSRKVDPHSNEQTDALPTDYVESFELPDSIAAMLPKDLAEEVLSSALRDIKYALGEFTWEHEAGPYRYTRAEASSALRDLLKTGDFRRQKLAAINQRAYNLLYDSVTDPSVLVWMLDFNETDPPVSELKSAALSALEMLGGQRGPEQSSPLYFLVSRLCHTYENVTGKRITHHTKTNDLAYSQDAQTDAGRFVTSVIHTAFEDIPATRISRYLAAFVKYRPSAF